MDGVQPIASVIFDTGKISMARPTLAAISLGGNPQKNDRVRIPYKRLLARLNIFYPQNFR